MTLSDVSKPGVATPRTETAESQQPCVTPPVKLRHLALPGDVETAASWYANPEVLYFSEGAKVPPFSKHRIENMYRWLSEKGTVYIIEVFEGKWVPVGDAALCKDLIPIVIGDNRYRNRGIGSRVLELLIEDAITLGWNTLIAHKVFSYNTPSIKLFEKYGFIRTFVGVDENGEMFFRYEKSLH
ncbi:GNAT family N-acetyltransferase [Alicyclobacillus sp. SO9]|uniref:GNAT family N-acetyltransferase n=1 Tax=Alicyclobacillus sp. SO9 TaxID=2665646 RepID=UPI0018E8CC19|nr:GNAT family protein [Alicyclobacillus sp. SO9]QQE81026.1 GNAT family N-acetyltransferase [Alicyclobacillus sp. SO9]